MCSFPRLLRLPSATGGVVRCSAVHGWHADEGGCPFGLAALALKEFQRQVDALDLAEPSFCFGSDATGMQVCLDLAQAREHARGDV